MNIEKLKSIIRLANNNPNEHEANLAARKACKILAENDFAIFKQTRTAADKFNQHASNYSSGPLTWNDIKRSTEPFWKSSYKSNPVNRPATPPPNTSATGRGPSDPYYTYRASPKQEEYYSKVYDDIFVDPNWFAGGMRGGKTEARPEKKVRKCSVCGVEVETKRITSIFTCNKCEWEAFIKRVKTKDKSSDETPTNKT